jgi:hypothetical protein
MAQTAAQAMELQIGYISNKRIFTHSSYIAPHHGMEYSQTPILSLSLSLSLSSPSTVGHGIFHNLRSNAPPVEYSITLQRTEYSNTRSIYIGYLIILRHVNILMAKTWGSFEYSLREGRLLKPGLFLIFFLTIGNGPLVKKNMRNIQNPLG